METLRYHKVALAELVHTDDEDLEGEEMEYGDEDADDDVLACIRNEIGYGVKSCPVCKITPDALGASEIWQTNSLVIGRLSVSRLGSVGFLPRNSYHLRLVCGPLLQKNAEEANICASLRTQRTQ